MKLKVLLQIFVPMRFVLFGALFKLALKKKRQYDVLDDAFDYTDLNI